MLLISISIVLFLGLDLISDFKVSFFIKRKFYKFLYGINPPTYLLELYDDINNYKYPIVPNSSIVIEDWCIYLHAQLVCNYEKSIRIPVESRDICLILEWVSIHNNQIRK